MLSGIVTLLLLLLFVGIWVWAWQPRKRSDFEDAARLAVEDDR
ncbi:MAG: cbb3-type cytochrome c oxidase subunit 3 [Lysobacteraceae bacterium]|nr:MAG: cbb3-type cytochrome c oxidase subunit 3 [Xanthomonadaceae bacterium]